MCSNGLEQINHWWSISRRCQVPRWDPCDHEKQVGSSFLFCACFCQHHVPHKTKCPSYARVWERQRLWYFWSSEKREVLVSCFLSSRNLLFFLWLLANCLFLVFFPLTITLLFIRSYCSHLQINYKSLFLHGPRALWAQHLQLNTVANLVIFDKCLCALPYAFMIKLCDKVRLPAFNVEIWTMHVAALQNADKMQNLQCFPIAGFLAV